MLKNIPQNEALLLTELIPYQAGQVVSRTLSQNPHVSVTLFAFDKGEEISTHDSDGDALALVLSGRGRFTVDGKVHSLEPGECVVMPAQKPHALYAEDAFQMLLVGSFPRMTKRLFFMHFRKRGVFSKRWNLFSIRLVCSCECDSALHSRNPTLERKRSFE